MPKIDCSKTENFLRELSRAIKNCNTNCSKCVILPLCTGVLHPHICIEYILHSPEDTISIVQNWSDAHPIKTRLDDLKEKFPHAKNNVFAALVGPAMFGYCDNCNKCLLEKKCRLECWNEPLEGGATGE